MKDCVIVKVIGMERRDYEKLCKVLRRAFPENTIEIYTINKEWEL